MPKSPCRVLSLASLLAVSAAVGPLPCRAETNGGEHLRDADHYALVLPPMESREAWARRKAEIRQELLIAAGLWPPPKKCPLHANLVDKKGGPGFTVEKFYFESLPGFFATGNLYRPTLDGGPFPAVLMPHGHWRYGRLENSPTGSIPGRCIDFARQGYVVASIDMVGYNDSCQLPHDPEKSFRQRAADLPLPYEPRLFRGDFDFPRASLYGFNLGGLQLWNNIRALDFLCSLPDVDADRIGVTGASGGATQTVFLMTADDRVKVAAPVNIIGAAKHPGCRCENPPGLWIDTSTVEMAAAFSPRPLLLMSATKDPWTHSTPTREYPLIRRYYALDRAQDAVKNVHIEAAHNYNAQTRAAVYKWFHRHLKPAMPPIADPAPVSTEVAGLGDLRVFPEKLLPETAISGREVIAQWMAASERMFVEALPHSSDAWSRFAQQYRPALETVLALQSPNTGDLATIVESEPADGEATYRRHLVRRVTGAGRLEIESLERGATHTGQVVLIFPESMGSLRRIDSKVVERAVDTFLSQGYRVFRVRGFASGQTSIPARRWEAFSWPEAYNRGNALGAMQDILIGLAYAAKRAPEATLKVIGLGPAGVDTAMAAAVFGRADQVLVDLDGRDPGCDRELLDWLRVGAIKRIGDFRTAVLLLLEHDIGLLNPGATFDADWYRARAQEVNRAAHLSFPSSLSEAVGRHE